MKKSAKAVSIIGGSDGPTSIFLLGGKERNIFKRLVNTFRRRKYNRRRAKAIKNIIPKCHSMEETKQYMAAKYAAYEADESYPFYADRMLQLRLWMEMIDKRNEEMLKKAKMVSNEMFPMDCHLYIISVPEGTIEIEVENRLGFMGTSCSGDLKSLNSIIKDIYIYYGVSQEDIDRKTPRYQTLELALSSL